MAIRARTHLPPTLTNDPAAAWEFDLWSVFSGGVDKARVGRLPPMLARAVGASNAIVYLSVRTARKIRGKHPQIHFSDLKKLATAFHKGNVAREGKLTLIFWFESPYTKGRTIRAVVQATKARQELYLKTMYPIALHKLKALQKKAMMIRESDKD